MLRLFHQVSLPQLRASWGRTALVVGGVATGVSLLVAMSMINTSVRDDFRRTIELIAGPAALEVTLGVGEVGFDEAVADVVRSDIDVAAGVALVRGTIALADDPGETLQLFGADFSAEEDLRQYPIVATTDRRELLKAIGEPEAVLVTSAFAQRHHKGLGDAVRVTTPSGVVALRIRGMLEPHGLAAAFAGQLAVMDLPAAQLLLGKEGRIDQIDIVLRPGGDAAAVRRRLEGVLPAVLSVGPPIQRAAQYERMLTSFQALLTGISTLCLVAGVFIVYNATSTGTIHRSWTLAGLRVIGADGGRIFRLLMLETMVLAIIGALVGVGAGVALGWLLLPMVTDSMGINFQLRVYSRQVTVDPGQILLASALGVAAAMGASYFAARRAARAEPIDVLRADLGTLLAEKSPPHLVRWWLVLIGVSAVALFVEMSIKSAAWGNLGASLWSASVMVIAIPVAQWVGRTATWALPLLFPAIGRIAAENLFRSVVRTGVTSAAIALALTVAITLSSVPYSFRESMNSYVGKFLSGDLIVSAVATEGGWLESPVPESLATELASLPGVSSVEFGRALTGQPFRGARIGVLAVSDGLFAASRQPDGWYREGTAKEAEQPLRTGRGVNVSTTLADRHGLHVGDPLELETPTGILRLPIVGVVPDYVSDHGSVILSRRLFVERWKDTTLSRINVFGDGTRSLDDLREEIAGRFRERYRLKVLSVGEALQYHARMINRAFAFTDAIQLLIAIVSICGVFDLLVSTIVERRRELALWRVIGADERTVRGSVVLEAATVGTLGAVLGVGVGVVTAWLWIKVNLRYLLGYDLEYHFASLPTALSLVIVVLMTLAAGYAAARMATRQSVLEGIRNE